MRGGQQRWAVLWERGILRAEPRETTEQLQCFGLWANSSGLWELMPRKGPRDLLFPISRSSAFVPLLLWMGPLLQGLGDLKETGSH